MKRKQKVPRRTRRQISPEPAFNVEETLVVDSENNEGKTGEINIKLPGSNLNVTMDKPPMKDITHHTIDSTVSSKGTFPTQDSSTNNLRNVEEKHPESEIDLKDVAGNSSQHSKQHNKSAENFNLLKHNVKNSRNTLTPQSRNNPKKPVTFVNFKHGSEDDNFPFIVNVFSLSKVPAVPHIKQIAKNLEHENNFPVTPPSSPPLAKPEQYITSKTLSENSISSRNKVTSLSSDNDFNKPAISAATNEPHAHNLYTSVGHDRERAVNRLSVLHTPTLVGQGNFVVEGQTIRVYHANDKNNIPLAKAHVINSNVVCCGGTVAPSGALVTQENKVLAGNRNQDVRAVSKENKSRNLCVYSELLQDMEKKHLAKYRTPNVQNQEVRNTTQERVRNLLGCGKNDAVPTDKQEAVFTEHSTRHPQHYEALPEATTTKTSNIQCVDESDKSVRDNHAFLSPRDIKVLALKRRLREQEETLKRLRKNI